MVKSVIPSQKKLNHRDDTTVTQRLFPIKLKKAKGIQPDLLFCKIPTGGCQNKNMTEFCARQSLDKGNE
ncbi:hypothetical protein KAR10_01125, partial [bacterium]|nr:hypothetical protein [bacterium]